MHPSPISYDLHAYSPLMCSCCQSFDHDVNSCPYYDILDSCYAKLNAVIETMNEQHECFVGKMRECGLLHVTDPSPSSFRLEVSIYDDYESSLPLEPTFMTDSPLSDPEEVIDSPLTSLPFVALSLSSTHRDTIDGVLCLLFFPLSLAQCIGLEMGESLRGDASSVEDDSLD